MSNTKPKSTITGHMIDWHSYSIQQPNITLDGVQAEDLKTIIEELKKIYNLEKFLSMEDNLFTHKYNYDNPHDINMSILSEGIFDKLYEYWIITGYIGDKVDLRKSIYNYVIYADMDDQIAGTSEIKVPPVKIVYDYFKMHDDDINAHKNVVDGIFKNGYINGEPFLSYSYLMGYPINMPPSGGFYKIPLPFKNNEITVVFTVDTLLPDVTLVTLFEDLNSIYSLYTNASKLYLNRLGTITLSNGFPNNIINDLKIVLSISQSKCNIYLCDPEIKAITKSALSFTGSPNFNYISIPDNLSRTTINEINVYPFFIDEPETLTFLSL